MVMRGKKGYQDTLCNAIIAITRACSSCDFARLGFRLVNIQPLHIALFPVTLRAVKMLF